MHISQQKKPERKGGLEGGDKKTPIHTIWVVRLHAYGGS